MGDFGEKKAICTLSLNFASKKIAKKREKMVNVYAGICKKSQKRKNIVQNITK